MRSQSSLQLEKLRSPPIDLWRATPSLFAQAISKNNWVPYRWLEYISDVIFRAILKGDGRIIVTVPPRFGKSSFISQWLPIWFLEVWPHRRVILTSYGAELATSWGRRCRNIIQANESRLYLRLSEDSTAANRFNTTVGQGGMITCGVGGSITGKGGDLILVDDPIKNWRDANSEVIRRGLIEWFDSTLYTRKEPNGTIIVLSTRWHHADLVGYLVHDHADQWDLINFPAICEQPDEIGRKPGESLCPERYDEEELKKIELAVGPRVWASLYQQHPTVREGEIWRTNAWKFYDETPEEKAKECPMLIQSWDLTFKGGSKSDFVVGQVWAKKGQQIFLVDLVRGQWDFTQTISNILMLSAKWPGARSKLIESAANANAVQSVLRSKMDGIELVPAIGTKEERAMSAQPAIEAGNVFLPSPEKYPWVQSFIEEASYFPAGQHDDQVDAASQAILHLIDNFSTPSILVL